MKLSKQLQAARTDRPDEWTMDRFIKLAQEYEKVIFNALTEEEAYNNGERVYGKWVKPAIDLIGEEEEFEDKL